MTLRLLKKLRTIPHSIPVWATSLALCAPWCQPVAFAADAPSHVRRVAHEEPAPEPSALERLKQRSPRERWNELKARSQAPAAPLPVDSARDSQRIGPESLRETLRERPVVQQPRPAAEPLPTLPEPSELEALDSAPRGELYQVQAPRSIEEENEAMTRPYGIEPPDIARSLTKIQPFADFEGSQETLFGNSNVEGVDLKRTPVDLAFDAGPLEPRLSPETIFSWEASNLWHHPLYFEDPTLERYGHVGHPLVQPFVSTGRMTVQLLGLPYQTTIDPVCKRRYTLGWYRPGECAPKLCYQIPFNWDAAAVEAGAVTAGFFIFP